MGGQRRPVGLGVSGHEIRFRSPRRRNLAARLEIQFLAEASIQNPQTALIGAKFQKSDEPTYLAKIARDFATGKGDLTIPTKRLKETSSLMQARLRREQERREWMDRFVETYLHWMRWGDKRPQREEASKVRNIALAHQTRHRNLLQNYQKNFPSSEKLPEDNQRTQFADSVGEMVMHRITATTKAHIRRTLTELTIERKRRRKNQAKKMRYNPKDDAKYADVNQSTVAHTKGLMALGKYPNTTVGCIPAHKKFEPLVILPPPHRRADKTERDLYGKPGATMSGCMIAADCPFQYTFMQGLMERDEHQKALLNLSEDVMKSEVRHALKDFSLADPPRKTYSNQSNVLSNYVEKWNQRVRRHLHAPPESSEKYTLFDEDPTESGFTASKDVTADFDPAMLFEKAKEKESLYKNMAAKTAEILDGRLAYENWIRTTPDDVRLTDLQEWAGLGQDLDDSPQGKKRRVQWVNGPPYFGSGSAKVIEDLQKRQSVCKLKNFQSLAKTMADYISQPDIHRRVCLRHELDLPTPAYFRSDPPWLGLVDAGPLLDWEEKHRKKAAAADALPKK